MCRDGVGSIRGGDVTARRCLPRRVVAVVLLAVVAACTGADSADPGRPTSAGAAGASSEAVTPGAVTSEPSTPQDAALAAYERYTASTVEALSSGDAAAGRLASVADDQALANAQRRLRANRRDEVVVTGSLTPSATIADVRFDGDRTARVRDCVLNGLEQVAADDPDRVVTAATGWRQPVEATVEHTDKGWVVTRVKVPLRDGSGRVPPPPDDPPYLRGPAQGPAPPSCVPDDIAQEAVAGYESFRDAYDSAIGYGRSGPADPDLPGLAETAVDPQLSGAREFASELARDGQAFRGEPSARDPWAIATLESDQKVIVYDCVGVRSGNVAAADATEPLEASADVGTYRLDAAEIVHTDSGWKTAAWAPLEEGLEACTSAPPE
jgi:hypothetical protein